MAEWMVIAVMLALSLLTTGAVIGACFLLKERIWDTAPPPVPREGSLARELHRQLFTPRPNPLRTLNPIFGFELYPEPMRAIYDRSRGLDGELLQTLCADPNQEEALLTLQNTTRAVRRRLMLIMIHQHGLIDSSERRDLHQTLDRVEEYLQNAQAST